MLDANQIILTGITAIVPAIISYFVVRHKGKTDLRKASDFNKAEIEKLVKQHEINLEAFKEQHIIEMEAKEKEQEYKLQLMQKEFELKIHEQQQFKANDVVTNALGGLFTDIISNPNTAADRIKKLQDLGDRIKKPSEDGGNK